MKELKEVLELVKQREENAKQERYNLTNGKLMFEIDRYKVGKLDGEIQTCQNIIGVIERYLGVKNDNRKEQLKELGEMLEVLAFLSFLEDMLGLPNEHEVKVHKFSNEKDFEEFLKSLIENK
jgi:hypothetical protein